MTHRIIGVMSGSSLDGLDMALCVFEKNDSSFTWHIEETQTIPFTESIKSKLRSAASMSGFELMKLNADFGTFMGQEIKNWIREQNLQASLIASHGHTVFHHPAESFTTQIGSGAHIAAITGIDTMVDFRQADVAHGGQGAPFAPVADRDLFSGYDGYLNLGGIANVSLHLDEDAWKGWDICPCNQALNFLANQLGFEFDDDGHQAKAGRVHYEVVEKLITSFPVPLSHVFSISNEQVEKTWISELRNRTESVPDLLASATEAINQLIVQHISSIKQSARILVTGGGAHNAHLLGLLNENGNLHALIFERADPKIIDYKECLLMAYLGHCTIMNKPYRIYELTGARSDSIGGALYKATK